MSSPWSDSGASNTFPFLGILHIPKLYKLTNDPIYHNLLWRPISHRKLRDIPKFEGKQREDPGTHITTYHLWCVSNSMVDDIICLWLFPGTLTSNVAKWYIELPHASVNTFGALAMEFLKNFQLPIHYETRTKLLTSLHQDMTTHIFDHTHEWRHRQRLVKALLHDYLLADWFCRSLLSQIAKDVTLGGAITKD